MSFGLGILGLLVPIIILGGLGALVFLLVRGGPSRGEPLSSRTMLRAYLRFAYLASLVILLVGGVFVLTAAFGAAFGHDFSYARQGGSGGAVSCALSPGEPAGAYQQCQNAAQQQSQVRDTRQTENLILGISLLAAGLVIGAGHRLGQFAVETDAERRDSALTRTERVLATCGFGLVTIIAVPSAVYQVLRYAILGTQPSLDSGQPDPPGTALAMALMFGVAWAYYLQALIRGRGTARVEPRPAQSDAIAANA
ncbi:MAG: hypothetical protein ABR541_00125 [Candidatus Dormibacteria bacterium]